MEGFCIFDGELAWNAKGDNSVLFEALSDYHEAEWRIDITVADDAEIEKIKELAQMEIFELNGKALEMAHEYEGKRGVESQRPEIRTKASFLLKNRKQSLGSSGAFVFVIYFIYYLTSL